MEISVVVPYAGGLELLERQLAALTSGQDFAGDYEVVVSVNSANCDLPPEEVAAGGSPNFDGGRVRFVPSHAAPGPSGARNVGWRASRGDFVLFCDADDQVDGSWITQMVAALTESPVVGGRLEYRLLNEATRFWDGHVARDLPVKFQHLPFAPSCNLGVRREVLLATGGFDESLRTGEDIDFCWRAAYAGFTTAFAPAALVHYRLRTQWRAAWRQGFNYGLTDAALLVQHRSKGARRTALEGLKECAGIARALLFAILDFSNVPYLVMRAGNMTGRIVGSYEHRVWAV